MLLKALQALANPDSLSLICDARRCVLDLDDSLDEDCVHFETPTDALLARLHLQQHNIPPRYIDMFLTLMQHKDFKPRHATFRKTADIDAGIAKFRQRCAVESVYANCGGAEARWVRVGCMIWLRCR